jgi:hypothetical protein
MELKIELTKDEMAELAKMAYIAQYVMDSSGPHAQSSHYRYPNLPLFKNTLQLLYRAMLQQMPQTELLEVNEKNKTILSSIKIENEIRPVFHQFEQDGFLSTICTAITDRDYTEEYGGGDDNSEGPAPVMGDNSVYDILYQNNWKELKRNGLKNFRLQ